MSGNNGRPGNPGQKGAKGLPGKNGEKGEKGQPGPAGAPGNPGTPGTPGLPGNIGEKGPQGGAGDDGISGAPGQPGLPGQKGSRGPKGFKGPNGKVDLNALYGQIKDWLRPMVKCPKCDKKPQPNIIPVNAIFLVDGSDSIRGEQGSKLGANEWELSSLAVQEITRRLKDINEITLVQFSDKTVCLHKFL